MQDVKFKRHTNKVLYAVPRPPNQLFKLSTNWTNKTKKPTTNQTHKAVLVKNKQIKNKIQVSLKERERFPVIHYLFISACFQFFKLMYWGDIMFKEYKLSLSLYFARHSCLSELPIVRRIKIS